MSRREMFSVYRALCAALLLGAPCIGDERSYEAPPVIRRIFVPATAPERWPAGRWEPILLGDLENRLATQRQDQIELHSIGIERAEYRATLKEDRLEQGSLQWNLRQSTADSRFLPLDPLNLEISKLDWMDLQGSKSLGHVVWGTAPSKVIGLIRTPNDAVAAGVWSLAGRRMARSTEFQLQIPPAVISRMVIDVPLGRVPAISAGTLSGPHNSTNPGFASWEIVLGSRTSCRIRFSPQMAETVRRPLVVTRCRTHCDVRPEVVQVQAEFDLEIYETTLRETRLQIDEGLTIVNVEYGDDFEVAWRVVDGSDGRAIVVQMPGTLTGVGHILRVVGVSPGKPHESWRVPRIYLPDAVEANSQVTIRFQPPYQAADLQMDGYRQTEIVANASDGESVVVRQLKSGASLSVVPSNPRLSASCHSVSLARLESEEWSMTTLIELSATTGNAFDVSCRVPEGWEVVNVQGVGESVGGELAGWDATTSSTGESQLRIEFAAALRPNHSQRFRVTARRNPAGQGSSLQIPALICTEAVNVSCDAIIVAGPDERPVLQNSSGWEMATVSDLSAPDQSLDFVRALSAGRSAPMVLRTNRADASGTLALSPLDGNESTKPGLDQKPVDPVTKADEPGRAPQGASPLTVLMMLAQVRLDPARRGFDQFDVAILIRGSADSALRWEMPEGAEGLDVRWKGHSVDPEEAGTTYVLTPRESAPNREDSEVLNLRYRIPYSARFGPQRRRIALPRMHHPVLECRWTMHIPRNLQFVERLAICDFTPAGRMARTGISPFIRPGTEPRFNPFADKIWGTLTADKTDKRPPTLPSRDVTDRADHDGESQADETWTGETWTGETWTGTGLTPPADFEVVVWQRDQVVSLSWALWCLSLLMTVAFRIRAVRGRHLAIAIVVALLGGGMLVLAPLYAELAKTALVAILIGLFVPDRVLAWRCPIAMPEPCSVPTGSTRSFATALLWTLPAIVYATLTVRAQDDRRTVENPAVRSRRHVDVLIPCDSSGRPSGTPPVAYLSADDLQRLTLPAGMPPYLLSGAAVHARCVDGRQIDVVATFDVFVLSADGTVPVDLPLSNAVLGGPDSCLVDGQSRPVMLSPGGRGFVVELPGRVERPVPVSMPEDDADSAPATDQAETLSRKSTAVHSANFRRIELRLIPQVQLEANETFVARLGTPVICNTIVDFSASGMESVLVATDQQAGETSRRYGPDPSTPSSISAQVKPTDELQFRWSRNLGALQAPPVELTAYVSALIDASPTLTTTTYQVQYQVHAGTIDSLTWKLPHGSALVSVHSPGLSGYVIDSGEGDARRLYLEFASPQSGNVAVTATLIQPMPRGSVEGEIPLLELDSTSSTSGHITLGRYQVAFHRPVDFQLRVSAANPTVILKPRTVEDFLRDFPATGAPPQQAYELNQAGPLKLTLDELPANLTAKTRARGEFGRGRLDWTYEADIDQPSVPPFSYRLRIDPRLRIRSVSVRENDADRLLRWSQQNETVVLFLNDRAVQPQTLRFEATMFVIDSALTALPDVELVGIRPTSSSLTLTRARNVSVQLSGAAGELTDAAPSDALMRDSPNENPVVARFDEALSATLPQFRMENSLPNVSARLATFLRRNGTETGLTHVVEYVVRSGREFQFELELPTVAAERTRLETSQAVQTIRNPNVDGRTRFLFFPLQPISDRFRVIVKTRDSVPSSDNASIPLVSTPGASMAERVLIVPPEFAADLPIGSCPEWVRQLPDGAMDIDRAVCHIPPAIESPVTVHAVVEHTTDELPRTLADVSTEFLGESTLTGRYVLSFPGRAPATVVFVWPQAAEPAAVLVDGQPKSIPTPRDGLLTVPLSDTEARSTLLVQWIDRSIPQVLLAGRAEPRFPEPKNVSLTSARVTTRISPRFLAHARQLTNTDFEVMLERWETALLAIERQSPPQAIDSESWIVIYAGEVAAEARRLMADAVSRLSAEQLQRLEILEKRSESLKLTILPKAGDFAVMLAKTPVDRPMSEGWWTQSVIRSDSPSTANQLSDRGIVLYNRRAIGALSGSLVAGIASLAIWKLFPILSWLQRREALCWLVLGLFWWLTLRFGLVGLTMIAWGMIRLVLSLRQSRGESPSSPATWAP